MARSTHRRRLRTTVLGLVLMLSTTALQVSGATANREPVLVIEPASTRAGIARVHLEIGELRQTGDVLEGSYEIRVPLSPKEDDIGHVVLHTSASVGELGGAEATLTGSAVSSSGKVHEVVARTGPDGVVRIRVVTPKRTLRFKSRYLAR